MSKRLRDTAVTTRKAPRAVAPAIPVEKRPLPGLAALVTFDRLAKDFDDQRKKALAAMRPALDAMFAAGAGDKKTIADVTRTYSALDGVVSANVQLRGKSIKKLTVADALALNKVKIPLRAIAKRVVVNPLYAGDGDAEGNQAVLVSGVVDNLRKLIAAHPECGVPADFFVTLDSVTLPVEDALLRALQLPAEARAAPLAILADIAVPGAEMSAVDPLIAALNAQIEKTRPVDPAVPAAA